MLTASASRDREPIAVSFKCASTQPVRQHCSYVLLALRVSNPRNTFTSPFKSKTRKANMSVPSPSSVHVGPVPVSRGSGCGSACAGAMREVAACSEFVKGVQLHRQQCQRLPSRLQLIIASITTTTQSVPTRLHLDPFTSCAGHAGNCGGVDPNREPQRQQMPTITVSETGFAFVI